MQFRNARLEDEEGLWDLANDVVVRANSFHPELITLGQHIKWIREKLGSSKSDIWVAELNDEIVGQIRYDLNDDGCAEIDFSVKKGFRGEGIGSALISSTWETACKKLGAICARGIVFEENIASACAFVKADFAEIERRRMKGKLCRVFEKEYIF